MEKNKWEDAYLKQSQDAITGRLYRGLIHNINGEVQGLMMQSELLFMAFAKAGPLIEQVIAEMSGQDRTVQTLEEIRDLFHSRAKLLENMSGNVKSINDIMHRTSAYLSMGGVGQGAPYSVKTIIEEEVKFLAADSFFKHKVGKVIEVQDDVVLHHSILEIHQVVYELLMNACEAMQEGGEPPKVLIRVAQRDDGVSILVEDSGPGIDNAVIEQIFSPFYSTREGKVGLGLYLARKCARAIQGELSCESRPGCTQFMFSFPLSEG